MARKTARRLATARTVRKDDGTRVRGWHDESIGGTGHRPISQTKESIMQPEQTVTAAEIER
jgi:hypothetical protein